MILFPYYVLLRSKVDNELNTRPEQKLEVDILFSFSSFPPPPSLPKIYDLSIHLGTSKTLNQTLERKVVLTTCRQFLNNGLDVLGRMSWGRRL